MRDYAKIAEAVRYCSTHICNKECVYYEICYRDRVKEYFFVTNVGFDALRVCFHMKNGAFRTVSLDISNVRRIMQEPTIYKPKDLQKIFGLSKNTVYAMVRQDTFPAIRVGRQYFIPKAALLEWLQTYQGKQYYIA